MKKDLGSGGLDPLDEINEHFSIQPAKKHIHIIVRRPDENTVVYCTAPPRICVRLKTFSGSQKPFSWYNFQRMKELFGLKVKDFDNLPTITPKNIRNSVIDEILRKFEPSPSVIKSNEANCRKWRCIDL
ncbi:hypothetical protein Glove_355g16 [Diversispora epigaea]|uniref:Uncharacterized protein n=1 Tax=Diversispora epigaea TaxID=1348612 RepID=A0A397HB06_9GLOM|nr:hypothetical protein Glove_355g16 [Diversispora epigaea]